MLPAVLDGKGSPSVTVGWAHSPDVSQRTDRTEVFRGASVWEQ